MVQVAGAGEDTTRTPKNGKRTSQLDEFPTPKRACGGIENLQAVLGVYRDLQDLWFHQILTVGFHNNLTQLAATLSQQVLNISKSDLDCGHAWVFHFGKSISETDSRTKWVKETSSGYPAHWSGLHDREFVSEDALIETLGFKRDMRLEFQLVAGGRFGVLLKVLAIGPMDRDSSTYPKVTSLDQLSYGLKRAILSPSSEMNLSALEYGRNNFDRYISAEQQKAVIKRAPAYGLRKKHRMDAFFPKLGKALIKSRHAGFTLGLSSIITCDTDSTFFSLFAGGSDVLFAPSPFASIEEFLAIAEKACASFRSDNLHQESWADRMLFPSTLDREAEQRYNNLRACSQKNSQKKRQRMQDIAAADSDYSDFSDSSDSEYYFYQEELEMTQGTGCEDLRMYRFSEEQWNAERERLRAAGFSFAAMFPETHRQLTSGRFRWLSYDGSILRVCVGRGTGWRWREAHACNILREWHVGISPFGSLHDLLCAVESSWVMPGQVTRQLGEVVLPVDADGGPSHPFPAAPPLWLRKEDSTELRGWTGIHACVTALAFAPRGEGCLAPSLFVGQDNGCILQWDLDSNTLVGKVRAYRKDDPQLPIAGMLVNPAGTRLYTWSYDWAVKVWDCTATMRRVKTLRMWMKDLVDEGDPADLCFMSVVLQDSVPGVPVSEPRLFLGLRSYAVPYVTDEPLADSKMSPGNIAIVSTDEDETRMVTWRGHQSPVSALAIVPGRYLLSVGTGIVAENLILWDLNSESECGTVLRDHRFCSRRQGYGRSPRRVRGVQGIAVHEETVVLLCNFGELLAVMNLQSLNLLGYIDLQFSCVEQSLVCGMAAYGGLVAPTSAVRAETLCFEVDALRRAAVAAAGSGRQRGELAESEEDFDESSSGDDDDDDDEDEEPCVEETPAPAAEQLSRRVERDRARALARFRIQFPLREVRRAGPGRPRVDPERDFGHYGQLRGVRQLAVCATHVAAGYLDGSLRVHTIGGREGGGIGPDGWRFGEAGLPACMTSCCVEEPPGEPVTFERWYN